MKPKPRRDPMLSRFPCHVTDLEYHPDGSSRIVTSPEADAPAMTEHSEVWGE